jgi:tRNA nucleotidyltransferase (CCA-adding enzyme)
MDSASQPVDPDALAGRIAALPAPILDRLRSAAGNRPVYLVGGTVRDLLLGATSVDLDVVVEGDAAEVARALGGEAVSGDRFRTARAEVDGTKIDLATARRERYERPGALPSVEPATLAEDLARRDFTINAMAHGLGGEGEPGLIDPHGGLEDLRAGVIRVLHRRSLQDDPTRALRAARYAARLGLALEGETEDLVRAADLSTVSRDRVQAELERLAAEEHARRGFELLAGWVLIELPSGAGELIDRVQDVLRDPAWRDVSSRVGAVLAAADGRGEAEAVRILARAEPPRPSEGVRLARDASGTDLVLARALGAGWLDRYVGEWRDVRLEITGADLMASGVPEGPAIGRGLESALAAKLDGEVGGRAAELERALETARK